MDFSQERISQWIEQNSSRITKLYEDFLCIASISTDPHRQADCRRAAQWLYDFTTTSLGMTCTLLEGSGLPVVLASWKGQGKSLMLYHHYDVQPVDPLELWQSDPFTPVVKEGKMFARGASDNKGQCFASLMALLALYELGMQPSYPVTLFIEGEEESGGKGTRDILWRYQDQLRADYLWVIDFDAHTIDVPAVSLGYRGLVTTEIFCRNADTDLHSGVHGGIALSALRILTEALAALWDEKGLVTLPGFYEGVECLAKQEAERMDCSFDPDSYRAAFGVGAFIEQDGISPKAAATLYPTAEINGLWGGYTGEGFKTVIPAVARAKVSFRLVGSQDPEAIVASFREFLSRHTPKGAICDIVHHQGAKAFVTAEADAFLRAVVVSSLEKVYGAPCLYTMCGGSIPIIRELVEVTQAQVALFGFALDTDNIHAPNEHFALSCLYKGIACLCQMVHALDRVSS